MMKESGINPDRRMLFPKVALAAMIETLMDDEYTVIAPVLHRDVIKLAPVTGSDEIVRGLRDLQDGGRYRLEAGDETLFFEYVVGPDSAKPYFFPPIQELFSVDIRNGGFGLRQTRTSVPKLAILGLRPCDLAAIGVQDQVFAEKEPAGATHCEAERYYRRVRSESLLIAVNCTRPGGTCFCDSMGTGPKAVGGFDVAMTELGSGFVVEAGSEAGMWLLEKLPLRDPTSAELELADLKLELAREHMGRSLDTLDIVGLLDQNIEHPRWEQVASRCLSCGNCTMVCPTCFCSTLTDSSDLSAGKATRTRRWESCFTHQFSSTTTGPHRHTIRGRYRHWMRHKLGTWWKQFGTSGCVGCGRCITWCPVGIDLTKEAAAIRGSHPNAVQQPVSPQEGEVTK
ncbi:MAG: 4Fe-4S dicluster domain-containing protein [Deltaproteobacteria bacterium]|nr:4Fe-4S dicluster domain-containing protein [Deltaproteobacteria bacterium]